MRGIYFLILYVFCACDEVPPPEVEQRVPIDSAVVIQTEPEPEIKIKETDYDTSQWREMTLADSVILDMRYATTNNFVKEVLYDCGRCFLRPEAAQALLAAKDSLLEMGFKLKMFDCFRPLPVQQRLWDKFQNPSYVTPPSKGSMHNRGLAVDLTIVDQNGLELDMGTEFDFFGKEAHHDFYELPEEVLKNRKLLKNTMASVGFKSIRTEWWHYSFSGKSYELSDMLWSCSFEK